ncbi:low molecular weight protein-tyrosine-phosphatase [Qipengyuania marisflavi]|uniref:protein-tyrosine-phosphatase n=1 Tax=Qipengyuania marisflavi TaxID=2486356 RepID=A0A5S3PAG8_9SPHN|nr:low molecular weight protein-tyrosine-phosphatase [Qipengyuania marisflavi]TMM49735.1 low molecular weight phosphotyrosine protein phosphatase [Qipengyuania marisflavi]
MSAPSVLFVCLGNICRSPLAEAAFCDAAERAGLAAVTDSAGTADYHVGEPPDPRTVAEAQRHGIDITQYRGRQLEPADFERFAWIVGMDHANMANIERIRPADSAANVVMLLDLVAGREGQEVADPWYGEQDGFAVTWSDVSAGAAALIERLR